MLKNSINFVGIFHSISQNPASLLIPVNILLTLSTLIILVILGYKIITNELVKNLLAALALFTSIATAMYQTDNLTQIFSSWITFIILILVLVLEIVYLVKAKNQ